MPEKELSTAPRPVFSTYSLTVCALLTALSVVLARVLTLIPAETTRISLEAVPIVLAGLLCGPLPGALVGFAADLIGCLISPFGYNPIFCVPPILYGLLAGLHSVAEHGAGTGIRRRRKAGIFPDEAGVPQHPVCPDRRRGHAHRVAAAAAGCPQRRTAAYPCQRRRPA